MANEKQPEIITKDFDTNIEKMTAEELIKAILGFMFDADNDTLTLSSTIQYTDGTQTTIKYEVKLVEVEG